MTALPYDDCIARGPVLLWGLGASGLAALRWLRAQGATVWAYDDGPQAAAGLAQAAQLGAQLVPTWPPPATPALAVVAPGVPPTGRLTALAAAGVPCISEAELAATRLRGTLMAITGTNGKSTTVAMLGAMVQASGRAHFVGGNLGPPLIDACAALGDDPSALVVAELSSFQLVRCQQLRPHIAVLLNIAPDHLDWHGSFAAYAAAKGRIFQAQGRGDHALVPADDPRALALAQAGAAEVHVFGAGEPAWQDGALVDRAHGLHLPLTDTAWLSPLAQHNACVAALAARLAGLSAATIAAGLRAFQPLPHRLAHVRQLDGVDYYDDSKATNVAAAAAAVCTLGSAIAGRVLLLAGGQAKEHDFGRLRAAMQAHGGGAWLFGDSQASLHAALQGAGPWPASKVPDLQTAVQAAQAAAQPGDAVLLAPACASFDQFASYAHRGRHFAAVVAALRAVVRPAPLPVGGGE
ncbi:MAG: UDP-N-acetylmuramoyl-L-alanine--D-glutamate ligase [Polyangiales bacterium]